MGMEVKRSDVEINAIIGISEKLAESYKGLGGVIEELQGLFSTIQNLLITFWAKAASETTDANNALTNQQAKDIGAAGDKIKTDQVNTTEMQVDTNQLTVIQSKYNGELSIGQSIGNNQTDTVGALTKAIEAFIQSIQPLLNIQATVSRNIGGV